ncbi:hypothetical protein HY970_04205 [Candidatus Kaiserbacteria bacterium]|nr:hypothetical protein [Candidatus Kaiserbacteria bacterium]
MTIRFIDSQTCEIDGSKLVYLRDALTVFRKIQKTLNEIGADKFYSSPENDVKRDRESLAELFFLLASKAGTGMDWYLLQPNDDFPDFYLMAITESDPPVLLHGFELTEVPPRVEKFEDAMSIVNSKLQRRYQPKHNLLIYLNNAKGREWTPLIAEQITNTSFKEIWTVQVLTINNNTELKFSVANRIWPQPAIQWVADFDTPGLFRPKEIPKNSEILKTDAGDFLQLKREFVKDFLKNVRRYLLSLRKS